MDNKTTGKPTLYYFAGNAKAGIARAILSAANIDFEDKRFGFEEWGKIKQEKGFEYGQVPAYEENGKVLTQSFAIDTYLAEKNGFYGSNAEERYEINNLLFSYDDLFPKFRPAVLPKVDDEEAKKFLEESAPKFLQAYEKKIPQGKDYVVGNKFSLADIYLSFVVNYIFRHPSRKDLYEPVLLKNAPNLAKHAEKIRNNELKNYFEKGGYNNELPF